MVGQHQVDVVVQFHPELPFGVGNDLFGDGEMLFGNPAQKLLEFLVFMHDKNLFNLVGVYDIVLLLLKADPRSDGDLFLMAVRNDHRVVV